MTTRHGPDDLAYTAGLHREQKQMEAEGLWSCVNVTRVENWLKSITAEPGFIPGSVYVYKKLWDDPLLNDGVTEDVTSPPSPIHLTWLCRFWICAGPPLVSLIGTGYCSRSWCIIIHCNVSHCYFFYNLVKHQRSLQCTVKPSSINTIIM